MWKDFIEWVKEALGLAAQYTDTVSDVLDDIEDTVEEVSEVLSDVADVVEDIAGESNESQST